jgi:hypothetical protein
MADIQLSATQIWLYTIIWGAFCGIVGWFANFGVSAYRIRVAREHALEDARSGRRRHFVGFLSPWAEDVRTNRRMANANNVLQTVSGRFDEKRLEFVSEAAQVASDFSDHATKFKRLVSEITEMTPGSS